MADCLRNSIAVALMTAFSYPLCCCLGQSTFQTVSQSDAEEGSSHPCCDFPMEDPGKDEPSPETCPHNDADPLYSISKKSDEFGKPALSTMTHRTFREASTFVDLPVSLQAKYNRRRDQLRTPNQSFQQVYCVYMI